MGEAPMSRAFSTLTIGLMLAIPGLAQQPVPARDALPGPKISFPDMAEFVRAKPNFYEDKTLGYLINYTRSGATVTIFVYNLGREVIPTGANSDAVKAEMLDSISALERNKASGKYM